MRLPLAAMIRRLLSVDRGDLRLAALHLVGGIVITILLILAARDTAYPPVVGFALALLIGGGLTGFTVWISLHFGGGEPPDGPAAEKNGSPGAGEPKP